MDFQLVFEKVISSFEKENLQYGLIGGFALGVMGILRATMDIDIDWELLDEYFSLFNKQALLTTLKKDFS